LQDESQRTDAAAPPTPAAPPPTAGPAAQQTTTPPPASAAPTPTPESTVTPRGLEGLRTESGGVEPRGFGSLGLAPDRTVDRTEALREAFRSEANREPLPFNTDLDTSLQYGYEHQEPMYLPLALSVGAGFKFGCGFMLAVGISVFGLFLAASVVFFVAALAGVPVPGAMP
jgi:hypothetical protein